MKKIVWFAAAILLFALTSCREQENLPYFHKEDNDFTSQLIRDDVKKEIVKYHKGRLIIVRYNLKTRSQVEEFLFKQLKKLKVI